MTRVMSNHVLVCLEMVLVSVQDRCMVCAKCTIGSETILDALMVLLGDEAHVEYLISVNLEIVLILTQDRCPVCAKRTKAQKSFWMHPMEHLGDVGHLEPCFDLFGHSVSVGAR